MPRVHGAGLILAPALLRLCSSNGPIRASHWLIRRGAAVGVHSAAMLTMTGLIATIVYRWADLGFLRRFWFTFDHLWTAALAATRLVLMTL